MIRRSFLCSLDNYSKRTLATCYLLYFPRMKLPSHFALLLASSVLCAQQPPGDGSSHQPRKTAPKNAANKSTKDKVKELPKFESTTLPRSKVWRIRTTARTASPSSLPSSVLVADERGPMDSNSRKIEGPNQLPSTPVVTTTSTPDVTTTSTSSKPAPGGVVEFTSNATDANNLPAFEPNSLLPDNGEKFEKYFTSILDVLNKRPAVYNLTKSSKAQYYDDLFWALDQASAVTMDFKMTGTQAKSIDDRIRNRIIYDIDDHDVLQMGLCIVVCNDWEERVSTWRISADAEDLVDDSVQKIVPTSFDPTFLRKIMEKIQERNIPVVFYNYQFDLILVAHIMGQRITEATYHGPMHVFDKVYDIEHLSLDVNVLAREKSRGDLQVEWTDSSDSLKVLVNGLYPMTTKYWKFIDAACVSLATYLCYRTIMERTSFLNSLIRKQPLDIPTISSSTNVRNKPLALNVFNSRSSSNSNSSKSTSLKDTTAKNLTTPEARKFHKYFALKSSMHKPPNIFTLNKSSKALLYDDLLWILNQANCVAIDFKMTDINSKDVNYSNDSVISAVQLHTVFQMGLCTVAFKNGKEYISTWKINACANGVLKESMFSADSLRVLKENLGEDFVHQMDSAMLDYTVLKDILTNIHERNVPVILHNGHMDLLNVAKITGKNITKKYDDFEPFFTIVYDTKILSSEVNASAFRKKRTFAALLSTNLEMLVNKLYPSMTSSPDWKCHDAAYDALPIYLVYQKLLERIVALEIDPLYFINRLEKPLSG